MAAECPGCDYSPEPPLAPSLDTKAYPSLSRALLLPLSVAVALPGRTLFHVDRCPAYTRHGEFTSTFRFRYCSRAAAHGARPCGLHGQAGVRGWRGAKRPPSINPGRAWPKRHATATQCHTRLCPRPHTADINVALVAAVPPLLSPTSPL